MRNIDRIDRLEKELGRYRKKVEDQQKLIDRLRGSLEDAEAGAREIQAIVDAVLTEIVLEYGERAMDPDDPETALGWRLTVRDLSVEELRRKYELRVRRDHGRKYLGVMERREEGRA